MIKIKDTKRNREFLRNSLQKIYKDRKVKTRPYIHHRNGNLFPAFPQKWGGWNNLTPAEELKKEIGLHISALDIDIPEGTRYISYFPLRYSYDRDFGLERRQGFVNIKTGEAFVAYAHGAAYISLNNGQYIGPESSFPENGVEEIDLGEQEQEDDGI